MLWLSMRFCLRSHCKRCSAGRLQILQTSGLFRENLFPGIIDPARAIIEQHYKTFRHRRLTNHLAQVIGFEIPR